MSWFEEVKRENRQTITRIGKNELIRLKKLFAITLRYSDHVVKYEESQLWERNDKLHLVHATNYSIIHLFDASFTLLDYGNVVSSRTLLRQIFEALVLSNYILQQNDCHVINRWTNNNLNFTRDVLYNIPKEYNKHFIKFLNDLNNTSHSSKEVTEIDVDVIHNLDSLRKNIDRLHYLLIMYNFYLRERFYPFIQDFLKDIKELKQPYRTDWFSKKDTHFKLIDNFRVIELIDAFRQKWIK